MVDSTLIMEKAVALQRIRDVYEDNLRMMYPAASPAGVQITAAKYLNDFDILVRYCDPLEVNTAIMRGYRDHLLQKYSARTAHRRWAGARAFYRWCTGAGLLESDPTDGVKMPVPPDNRNLVTAPLSPGEVRRFIFSQPPPDVARKQWRIAALLSLGAGLRVTEIAALTWSSVRLDTIEVSGHGDRKRVVPIMPWLRKELERWYAGPYRKLVRVNSPPCVVLTRGRRVGTTYLEKIIRRVCEQMLGMEGTLDGRDMGARLLRSTWIREAARVYPDTWRKLAGVRATSAKSLKGMQNDA